jgi:hypothetical protein
MYQQAMLWNVLSKVFMGVENLDQYFKQTVRVWHNYIISYCYTTIG